MTNDDVPKKESTKKKIVKVSQKEFPSTGIEKALLIARILWDEFGGAPTEPHQIAIALKLSPASSTWRVLTGSAIAYGLTDGGYNAKEIGLTPLGKSIVAPTSEGETAQGIVSAILKPQIMKTFFERFDNKKLPSPDIGANILSSFGVGSSDTLLANSSNPLSGFSV